MVEFAIVLPLFLLFVFGIIEFGALLYNKQVITNASREGARYGIVMQIPRPTAEEISAVVDDYAKSHMITFGTPNDPQTSVDNSGGTSQGDDLKVTVTYDFDFLVMPSFVKSLLTFSNLTAETVMKYE